MPIPTIPANNPFTFAMLFLLTLGICIILGGMGIIKIEKFDILKGRKSIIVGFVLIGISLLLAFILELNPTQAPSNSDSTNTQNSESSTATASNDEPVDPQGCPDYSKDEIFPSNTMQTSDETYYDYLENFENLKHLDENTAFYAANWNITDDFAIRLKENNSHFTKFVVPYKNESGLAEGKYSLCLRAAPLPVGPVTIKHLTVSLPDDELFRLSFRYKTQGNPLVKVYLTSGGSISGDFFTENQPTDDGPEPLEPRDSWYLMTIDFRVEGGTCTVAVASKNQTLFEGRNLGCFNLMFVVEGDGSFLLDDVRIWKSPNN